MRSNLSARLPRVRRQDPHVLPFGPWLPDLPALTNPGLTVARNVISGAMSYQPFAMPTVASDALDAYARGAIALDDTSSNAYIYVGNETKLYEIRSNTATDRSQGGGYSTASTDRWDFCEFDGQVIATNYTDPVQVNTIGTAGAFSDLIASSDKPKAKTCASVLNHVFLGNTSDTVDGVKPNRVWWSAYNDATDFTPAQSTQCDYEDLKDGGAVQRIVGGFEYALVFQQERITRFTQSGLPRIFDPYPIDRRRGTPLPGSVIDYGRFVFFRSEDGFYYNDGSQSHEIGSNQVDEYYWNNLDIQNAHLVSAAVDPVHKLVLWLSPLSGSTVPNKITAYNWKDRRWTEIDFDGYLIANGQTQASTLEDLDTLEGTDIDALTTSFDSDIYKGGSYRVAAWDTSHQMNFFDGMPMQIRLETGEIQLTPGRRTLVRKVRPIVDGTNLTLQASVASRPATVNNTHSYDTPATVDGVGETSQRNDGRYHRFLVTTASNDMWSHAQGLEIIRGGRGTR